MTSKQQGGKHKLRNIRKSNEKPVREWVHNPILVPSFPTDIAPEKHERNPAKDLKARTICLTFAISQVFFLKYDTICSGDPSISL